MVKNRLHNVNTMITVITIVVVIIIPALHGEGALIW